MSDPTEDTPKPATTAQERADAEYQADQQRAPATPKPTVKQIGKTLATGAVQGAITKGGLPGAAIGAAQAAVRNPQLRRWALIGIAVVTAWLLAIPIGFGLITVFSLTAISTSSQNATYKSIQASGINQAAINSMIAAASGTHIPWQLALAVDQIKPTVDLTALSKALTKQHLLVAGSTLGAGTVYDAIKKVRRPGTTPNQKQQAKTEHDNYVAALISYGLTPVEAENVYTLALGWVLGQTNGCSAGTIPTVGSSSALDPEQTLDATIIIGIAKTVFPDPATAQAAAVVGIATAIQESGLRNLLYGDRDSLGLFQQRASWGTAAERTTPAYAAGKFFQRLASVPGWQAMPVTVAAQTVQVSAFPNAYATHVAVAQQIVAALTSSSPAITIPTAVGTILLANPLTPTATACISGSTTGDPGPTVGGGAGFAPDSVAVETAIAYAEQQVGKPYVLGGAGPLVWDCSGLTMMAYRAAGVPIGLHDAVSQYQVMSAQHRILPYTSAKRGDLVFWQNATEGIYHVAIYLGGGMIVTAPQPGDVVKIAPIWGVGGDLMTTVARPTGTP